jgi:hypothetical protein
MGSGTGVARARLELKWSKGQLEENDPRQS